MAGNMTTRSARRRSPGQGERRLGEQLAAEGAGGRGQLAAEGAGGRGHAAGRGRGAAQRYTEWSETHQEFEEWAATYNFLTVENSFAVVPHCALRRAYDKESRKLEVHTPDVALQVF